MINKAYEPGSARPTAHAQNGARLPAAPLREVQFDTATMAATVASMFLLFSAATQMRPESTP